MHFRLFRLIDYENLPIIQHLFLVNPQKLVLMKIKPSTESEGSISIMWYTCISAKQWEDSSRRNEVGRGTGSIQFHTCRGLGGSRGIWGSIVKVTTGKQIIGSIQFHTCGGLGGCRGLWGSIVKVTTGKKCWVSLILVLQLYTHVNIWSIQFHSQGNL